jgi:hypothetical protein
MMHPDTRIHFVSETIGVGVVARHFIPQGTLIWVRDSLDRILEPSEIQTLPTILQDNAMTYMYRNCLGQYVLLWDHGKYVNHSFTPNCMPTPYGFDIALRDISIGAELSEDYGLLNIIEEFCPESEDSEHNRTVVCGDDLSRHATSWDALLESALRKVNAVPQPLWNLVPVAIQEELEQFDNGAIPLRSVLHMQLNDPK